MSSNKMILYYDQRSPPVRSVLLLLDKFNVDFSHKEIDLFKGAHLSPEFLEINPLHTVPALIDGDLTLTDSHAILIHLCEKYPEKSKTLWPTDSLERIQVLNKLFYSGCLLFRRDSDAMGQIIANKIGHLAIEEHVKKIKEQYDILETFLKQNKFIAGDNATIADLSIVTIVSTVDMLLPLTRDNWPKVYNWWQNIKDYFPSYEKINNEGLSQLKTAVQQRTDYPIKLET